MLAHGRLRSKTRLGAHLPSSPTGEAAESLATVARLDSFSPIDSPRKPDTRCIDYFIVGLRVYAFCPVIRSKWTWKSSANTTLFFAPLLGVEETQHAFH